MPLAKSLFRLRSLPVAPFALPFAAVAICAFPVSVSSQTNLGSVALGKAATATVTVTLPSAVTLSGVAVLTQGAPNLDFTNAGGGTCTAGARFAAKATCTVKVTFTPKFTGARLGAVVLRDASTAQDVAATVYLEGTGLGNPKPQAVFGPPPINLVTGYLAYPVGAAVDAAGNLYVTDLGYWDGYEFQTSPAVYQVTPNGTVNSIGSNFGGPNGVAVDGAGNVYIADIGFSYPGGVYSPPYSVPAGLYMETLQADGTYLQTTLTGGWGTPNGVAVDAAGNLYVSSYGSVLKETRESGAYKESDIGSGWSEVQGLAVDAAGNVFVIELSQSGGSVVKETLKSNGTYVQSTIGSGFSFPQGVAVDGSGNVYVSDLNFGGIYRETPASGGAYTQSIAVSNADIGPNGVAVDVKGDLFFTDDSADPAGESDDNALYEAIFENPPMLSFANTVIGATSMDSPQTVTVTNVGPAALVFSQVDFATDFPQAPTPKSPCSAGLTLAAGALCNLSIDFAPVAPLNGAGSQPLKESVIIATYPAGDTTVAALDQFVAVSGTETLPGPLISSITPSADPGIAGSPVSFTVKVTGVPNLPLPTGSVAFQTATATLGSAPLSTTGVAKFTTSALAAGAYSITALYSGDKTYNQSISSAFSELIVNPPEASVPSDLSMGSVPVSHTSAAIPLTVTFHSAETLAGIDVLTQGTPGLDFGDAGGGTCTVGAAYAAGAACTVNVNVTPRSPGTRYGAVVLWNLNHGLIGTGYLQATGLGPQTAYLPGTQTTIHNSNQQIATALAVDGAGNIYLANGNLLYKESLSGGVYTKTQLPGAWNNAVALAIDSSGNLYVAESGCCGSPAVVKGTLQSNGAYTQSTIGYGFQCPSAIAVDGHGNLYVADQGPAACTSGTGPAHVYKETLTAAGYSQSTIGSTWNNPVSLAVDGLGNLYAIDLGDGSVRPSVLKQTLETNGSYAVSKIGSGWQSPNSIAIDGLGNLYVADYGTGLVLESPGPTGALAQTVIPGIPYQPFAVGVGGRGQVFYMSENSLFKLDLTDPPSLHFASTERGDISSDSPQKVTLSNVGNAELTFAQIAYAADFPEARGAKGDCATATPLPKNESCTLTIDFKPKASTGGKSSLTLSEAIVIISNNVNKSGFRQSLAVSATETSPAAAAAP